LNVVANFAKSINRQAVIVKMLGKKAFVYDPLALIVLPKNITAIEDGTFIGCFSLTSVTIPNGIKSI